MSRAAARTLTVMPEPAAPARPARRAAAQPTKAEKTAAARTRALRQRVACSLGGVGVGVLTLSVWHCTEAITLLTGSHAALSCLLAIGIDAGMVCSELAELIAEDRATRGWARAYIALSVLMSMGLNSYAFAQHASVPAAGAALGILIPALVLILGRVAGHLAR